MERKIAIATIVALTAACPKPPGEPAPTSGFTEGDSPPPAPEPEPAPPVLQCPGETQCPCSAPAPTIDDSGGDDDGCPGPALTCGPQGACISNCATNDHCTSGVSGELCLGTPTGHCVVVCDPQKPHGGCPMANDEIQAECLFVLDTWVCGYPA